MCVCWTQSYSTVKTASGRSRSRCESGAVHRPVGSKSSPCGGKPQESESTENLNLLQISANECRPHGHTCKVSLQWKKRPTHVFVCWFVRRYVYLSVCLSPCLLVCLFDRLSTYRKVELEMVPLGCLVPPPARAHRIIVFPKSGVRSGDSSFVSVDSL